MNAERTRGRELGVEEIRLGNLTMNFNTFRTSIDDHFVELSYDEFELLTILAAEPDRVIPYEDIVSDLWEMSGRRPMRRLNVLVHRLRSKLPGLDPYEITTVRGRGYGLVTSLERSSHA